MGQASSSVIYGSFFMNDAVFDDRSFRLIGQQLRQAYANLASTPRGHTFEVQSHPEAAKDYWKANPVRCSTMPQLGSKSFRLESPR